MTAPALVGSKALDSSILEQSVPAHMLILTMEACQKIGLEFRGDVMHHLNNAAVAPLTRLDMFSVARLARRTDETATDLLKHLNADDPRDALYACAMFNMILADQGRIFDKGNQAVLVSMLVLDDVKDDKPDENGETAHWHVREKVWKLLAKKMLRRAEQLGLYSRKEMQLIA